jgi:hypothetical protein
MEHRIILDIRPVPNHDPIFICPQNGAKPDTHLISKGHLTTNGRILHNKDLITPPAISSHNNIGN